MQSFSFVQNTPINNIHTPIQSRAPVLLLEPGRVGQGLELARLLVAGVVLQVCVCVHGVRDQNEAEKKRCQSGHTTPPNTPIKTHTTKTRTGVVLLHQRLQHAALDARGVVRRHLLALQARVAVGVVGLLRAGGLGHQLAVEQPCAVVWLCWGCRCVGFFRWVVRPR